MPKMQTCEEAYNECKKEGSFRELEEVNIETIRNNFKLSEEDLQVAQEALTKKRYNTAYKLHYDVLHSLVEAFLRFDKVKSSNHKCLFAYLCIKHPELEFNWNFFEGIRTKRNGINYYGTPVLLEDWKKIELQFHLYINL